MKTDVVLDTSILVKIFLQESDSHLAVNLLDKLEAASAKIYCPNFAKIEFVSTLSKKLNGTYITADSLFYKKASKHYDFIETLV